MAAVLDYERLARRLDLPHADHPDEQLIVLRARRAELLDQLEALERTTRYPDIEACCRDELAIVDEALAAAGEALESSEGE